MKHTDSSNTAIRLGDIVLFDDGEKIGLEGAVEGVFVYNMYYKQYGFSLDSGMFISYELAKHHEVSFFKVYDHD